MDLKKLYNIFRLLFIKVKYKNQVYFSMDKCWSITIRNGFEIQQFPLPGKLKIFIGKNVIIEKDVWIKGSALFQIGDNTLIGRRTIIGCNNNITIGSDCLFAENVRIQDTDHQFDNVMAPIRNQGISTSPVQIGNDVWVGYGTVITKGVKIGDGCVIGANSVVTKDIPTYSIAVGAPARVIRKRGEKK